MLRGARARPDRRRSLDDSYAAECAAPRRPACDGRMKITCRSARGDGKREADRRPLPLSAVDRQLAAVRNHEVLDDREAEARTSELARAGLVHAVQALGDARQGCRWNAVANVRDNDPADSAPRLQRADSYAATRARDLYGLADE